MKELAELAYSRGGWWIWFEVYGKNFSIAHYPEDGVCTVEIDPVSDEENTMTLVGTVMELAEFIRKYCPDASEDSHEILNQVKISVRESLEKNP